LMEQRTKLKKDCMSRYQFLHCIAQQMLNFKEDLAFPPTPTKESCDQTMLGHVPVELAAEDDINNRKNLTCAVCKLEWNICRRKNSKNEIKNMKSGGIAYCKKCNITAHVMLLSKNNGTKIRQVAEGFEDMSCFSIAHTRDGMELWKRYTANDKSSHNRAYNIMHSHPLYERLCAAHGVDPKISRKRMRKDVESDGNNSDTDSDSSKETKAV